MVHLFPLTLWFACSEHELHRNIYEDVFTQELAESVDILFVIDDSVSMSEEQLLAAEGFFRFIEEVSKEELPFHLGVVTTDMDKANPERAKLIGSPPYLTEDDADYVQNFMDRVQVGVEGSNKEQGLEAAWEAINNPENKGFIREEAALALVFVSDENDCSNEETLLDEADGSLCYEYDDALSPVSDYIRRFQEVKGEDGRVVISGIIGPDVSEDCETSWPGHRYRTVIEKLDGLEGNICETNYEGLMQDMGSRIAGPIRVFQLSYAAVEETIEVYVDDALIDADPDEGWAYDPEYWMIRFDGQYVPPPASHISITYAVGAG